MHPPQQSRCLVTIYGGRPQTINLTKYKTLITCPRHRHRHRHRRGSSYRRVCVASGDPQRSPVVPRGTRVAATVTGRTAVRAVASVAGRTAGMLPPRTGHRSYRAVRTAAPAADRAVVRAALHRLPALPRYAPSHRFATMTRSVRARRSNRARYVPRSLGMHRPLRCRERGAFELTPHTGQLGRTAVPSRAVYPEPRPASECFAVPARIRGVKRLCKYRTCVSPCWRTGAISDAYIGLYRGCRLDRQTTPICRVLRLNIRYRRRRRKLIIWVWPSEKKFLVVVEKMTMTDETAERVQNK